MVRVKTTSTVPPMRGGKIFCNDPEVDRRRNETYYKLNYYVHIDYLHGLCDHMAKSQPAPLRGLESKSRVTEIKSLKIAETFCFVKC
jgi:hypothetical protein